MVQSQCVVEHSGVLLQAPPLRRIRVLRRKVAAAVRLEHWHQQSGGQVEDPISTILAGQKPDVLRFAMRVALEGPPEVEALVL